MSSISEIQKDEARFELKIRSIPDQESLEKCCRLIYGMVDRNLLASISATPFTVGRSFSRAEMEDLANEFKTLNLSFSFKSKPPYFESIEFDPREQKDQLPTFRTKNIRPQLIALSLVLVVLFSFWLMQPQSGGSEAEVESKMTQEQSSSPSRTKEPLEAQEAARPPMTLESYDALLKNIKGRVSHRKSKSLFWEDVRNKTALFEQDALRSFDQSYATISYYEGAEILLKPNSFVVIGRQIKEDSQTEEEISLNDGSINARLRAGSSNHSLVIQTEQGRVFLKSPRPGQGPNHLLAQVKDGVTEIAVAQGEAHFEHKNTKLGIIQIETRQRIEASQEQLSDSMNYTPTIELTFPPQNARITQKKEGESYIFSWLPLQNFGTTYSWRLASDSQMSTILLEQELSDTEFSVSYLDPGALYWQVSAELDGIVYKSPIYALHVSKRK